MQIFTILFVCKLPGTGTLNPHSHFMLQEQQPQVSAPHKRKRPGHHSQHPEQRRLRSSGSQHEQGAGHPIKRWTHEPAGSGLPATAFASRRRKRGGCCSGRRYCRPAGEGHVQHQPAEHRAHRGARGQQQSHGDHLPVHDTGDCGPGWAVRRLQDLLSERWVWEMLETKLIKIFNFMKFLISLKTVRRLEGLYIYKQEIALTFIKLYIIPWSRCVCVIWIKRLTLQCIPLFLCIYIYFFIWYSVILHHANICFETPEITTSELIKNVLGATKWNHWWIFAK